MYKEFRHALSVAYQNSKVPFYKGRERKTEIKKIRKKTSAIPVFIINYNRLTYLKLLIKRLEELEIENINIIDNNSTYRPLLEYYETLKYKVYRLNHNYGHRVFWECDEFKDFRKDFYVLTDSDVVPVKECPKDFLEIFLDLLDAFPNIRKVGFSLKIDDLPTNALQYEDVIAWETRFWKYPAHNTNHYIAPIDTTFALYVPDKLAVSTKCMHAIRTEYPYQAQHLPWYKTKEDISEEDKFYSSSKTNGWWDFVKGEVGKY